ncbi:ion channel [Paenibacillus sp. GCM10023252]|uniref:potassium channel protein n=1 Tax=Paenibacillus sp. GCM10023252 TaxID=3252649 RepID=UPI0036181CAB
MHFLIRLSHKLLRQSTYLLLINTVLLVAVSSTAAYLLEPDTFGNWFNAMWWVMTTIATVGYGDYYPVTPAGKGLAMLLYVFGIGLLSLLIGKIIDAAAELQRRRGSGKLKYGGQGHIIVINWSTKTKLAVEEILSSSSQADILIIDHGEKHPFDHPRVHFVSGDAASEDVLEQASITTASSAIIFADGSIDDSSLVDGKSLLIASSVERAAPNVHTTVEIMLEKHIPSFRHVQVNDFILSHDAVSRLAVRSALGEGNNDLIHQLLSRQHGYEVIEVNIEPGWSTYREAFDALLKQGATLIADRSDMGINSRLDDAIPEDARLYVLADPLRYFPTKNR